MFTNLDWLILAFMVISGVSLFALLLMFLIKNQKAKKIAFYFAAVIGMGVSWINALCTPGFYMEEILLGWGFGAMSVIAVFLEILSKSEKKSKIARILVLLSVLLGMWNAFIY